MPERLSLANAFDPPSGAEITQDAAQIRQAVTTIRQLAQAKKNDQLVRDAVKAATTQDGVSGTVATDQAKVIQSLRLKDPQVAEAYERHVEDITAEKTARAAAAEKARRETVSFDQDQAERARKLLTEGLSAIDENGDQNQAAADYASVVADLESQGIPVPENDKLYSKGKVALFKRQLIGAKEIYKAEQTEEEKALERASKEKIAGVNAGSRERVAQIRKGQAITTAMIKANKDGTGVNVDGVAPTRAPGRTTPGARLNTAIGDDASIVADFVLNSRRSGSPSKGGEITLRTDPDFKALKGAGFETLSAELNPVIDALKAGNLDTGPGRGLRNTVDRAAVGLRNFAGIGLPGVDEDQAENRVTAFDALEKVATRQGIGALAGIGGNDTDKDFDRALKTTVGNLRTKKFNLATALTTKALADLGREKVAFYQKWTSIAGSPNATINGQSFQDAWSAYSKPKQAQIAQIAEDNNLYNSPNPKKKAAAPTADFRIVKGPDGTQWKQFKDGRLQRVKK